jgi:L-ribulose-5-phosphate 3-epimerase
MNFERTGGQTAGLTIPIAAITDEFSPDLDVALEAMQAVGMTGAELRLIAGRNILELSDD